MQRRRGYRLDAAVGGRALVEWVCAFGSCVCWFKTGLAFFLLGIEVSLLRMT